MVVYYFLSLVAIWLGFTSLRGGLRFAAYVRRQMAEFQPHYTPLVSVIAPFRGVDENLRQNLSALFEQNYPAYEIVFVTDSANDPGLRIVEEVCAEKSDNLNTVGTRIVIAGPAADSGQKVHNLQKAVAAIDERSEVIVFVDSDARPHPNWLRSLVSPLVDETLGAATGYRWFVASAFSFSAQLRSVWNASITSALGEVRSQNFCWGGSTAIRRQTFENLNVIDRWRGTVSDDFALTRVLQEARKPIKFVPQCLIVSEDSCDLFELLEFTTRQLKITRVYAPHLWRAVLLGNAHFVLVFFGGFLLTFWRWWLGLPATTAFLLAIIFVLGAAKSWIRLNAVELALTNYGVSLRKDLLWHVLLWPVASALFLINAIAAAISRRIKWRGISYELKSPVEAVIIARESDSNG